MQSTKGLHEPLWISKVKVIHWPLSKVTQIQHFQTSFARKLLGRFHMEPPWDVANENLFKCSRSHDHAHRWWKTSKIFFITKRPMTLKLSIQHQVLEYYQCFHMMILGWPWPFLWQGHICLRMLLHGWKLIQHWVLIYFQVCSNSAYPHLFNFTCKLGELIEDD